MLILTMSATPVLAAEGCVPVKAAFSPGTWVANGIALSTYDQDDLSIVVDRGQGAFRLTISETGEASGSISLVGKGIVAASAGDDQSRLEVDWMINGNLTGNGMVVDVDGTRELSFAGVIDQTTASGGPLFRGFGNQASEDYHASFSPSDANCNQVFGSLRGPVEYGTSETTEFGAGVSRGESYFLAVRVGSVPNVDVESQLVRLMERAQAILSMNPVETDMLTGFVQDFVAFDALVASLDQCELTTTNAGPAWQMLRSILLKTAHQFLGSAANGEYTTYEVVSVMTSILQGGILGLRGNDCLSPKNPEGVGELMDRFDEELLRRLKEAHQIVSNPWGTSTDPETVKAGNAASSDIPTIVAAAYQFQLPATLAYIAENDPYTPLAPDPNKAIEDALSQSQTGAGSSGATDQGGED
jgi:hypothetical protein